MLASLNTLVVAMEWSIEKYNRWTREGKSSFSNFRIEFTFQLSELITGIVF